MRSSCGHPADGRQTPAPQLLSRFDPASLTDFGHLLETFLVGEVRKQASWLDEPVTLGHWDTSDGAEVDVVIEYDDGTVVAFEVKASERARGRLPRSRSTPRRPRTTVRRTNHPDLRSPLLHRRRPAPRHAHRPVVDPRHTRIPALTRHRERPRTLPHCARG